MSLCVWKPEQLPRLKSLSEAVTCLGGICDFLASRGYASEARSSNGVLDSLAKLHCVSQTKQTSITHYFSRLQNTLCVISLNNVNQYATVLYRLGVRLFLIDLLKCGHLTNRDTWDGSLECTD